MKPIKETKFENPIITIKVIGEKYILTSDSQTTLRYLDKETLEVKNQLKSNAIQERYVNSVVDFNEDGNYLALISSGAKESRLYNLKDKKLTGRVSRHQGDVSCVAIDPKSRYMFSGGDDGITFGMDIKSGQLAFTLPRHIDTINDIAFSKNANWVATASYDKNIALFNLITMAPHERLKAHSAPVLKVQFLTKNRLLSIDKKGVAIVWNISTTAILHRLQGIHDDVVKIVIDDTCKFLFIATKLGYIIVYDLDNYSLITGRYLKFESTITALSFDAAHKNLLIATEAGDLFIYDIFQYQNAIFEAISYKKYALIDGCIVKNPLLIYADVYEKFEALWEKTLLMAKNLIESGNSAKAMEFLKNFMEIPSKKQIAQKLFEKYRDYDKFVALIQQSKFALAYSMANSNPHYKETKAYIEMEDGWSKRVVMAQKYLLNPNNESKVREIFSIYRGVSEKTVIIQDLIQNSKIYNLFKRVAAKREFKSLFELVKRHQFLRESPEYKAIMAYSDKLYIKASQLVQEGEFHSAIKLYRELLEFDDFKNEAKEILDELENREKFFNAIEMKNYEAAYCILDTSDVLQMTPDGKRLEQIWERDYEAATNFAAKADVDGVKKTVAKYLKIQSKQMAIATLISWCYITQLNYALAKKMEQKKIEEGIRNYISYFGLTDQIVTYFDAFAKEYSDTKLNLEAQTQGSMESWRSSMIVKSILN